MILDQRATLFARSTGSLPSAIAIVRVSGPAASTALITLSRRNLPSPRVAVVRKLAHPTTAILLDTALVLWMPGPDTVTGEDVVELHLHGGRAVVAAVEAALAEIAGLEPAQPGSFTRRAFENGRLDLTQVEGLANLVAAETERQRTAALVLSEGGLRREVERWQTSVIELAAQAEALIDFDDEADVDVLNDDLQQACVALAASFETTLANPPAERLRDGVRIAIAGPPNAGKSTLLNALVGRSAAIASPIAGTTRDLIEVFVNIDGLPLVFTDMAGLRGDTVDEIERVGIERAREAIARSDIVLWLGPVALAPQQARVVRVASKSDLHQPGENAPWERADVSVSAVTGAGLNYLTQRIVSLAQELVPREGGIAMTIAQRRNVGDARDSLARAGGQFDEVLRAEDLRAALRALDRITGAADTEAMLDALFGRFCIGK